LNNLGRRGPNAPEAVDAVRVRLRAIDGICQSSRLSGQSSAAR